MDTALLTPADSLRASIAELLTAAGATSAETKGTLKRLATADFDKLHAVICRTSGLSDSPAGELVSTEAILYSLTDTQVLSLAAIFDGMRGWD